MLGGVASLTGSNYRASHCASFINRTIELYVNYFWACVAHYLFRGPQREEHGCTAKVWPTKQLLLLETA